MDREERPASRVAEGDPLPRIVEALLFASDAPLSVQKLSGLADGSSSAEIREALTHLAEYYEREQTAFHLVQVAGGYQLCTRPRFSHWVERLFREAEVSPVRRRSGNAGDRGLQPTDPQGGYL